MPPEQQQTYQPQQPEQAPSPYVAAYQQPPKPVNWRKWAIVGSLIILALLVFQWISTRAYIEITVDSSGNEAVNYTLTSRDGSEVMNFEDNSKTVKKLVSKGDYELLVSQGGASHFTAVKTGGFFSTTELRATPVPERGRRFVGDVPKECRHWLDNVLLSYNCEGTIAEIQTHVPATAKRPTFSQPSPAPTEDVVESLVHVKEGSLLLTYEAEIAGHGGFSGDAGHSPHVAYLLKNGKTLEFTKRTLLSDLGEDSRYTIRPYKDGFVAYSTDFSKAFFYDSLDDKPANNPLPESDSDLKPYDLQGNAHAYAVGFSEQGTVDEPRDDSEIAVVKDDQTKFFSFKNTFETFRFCGTDKLCGLSDKVLYIYDISGDKAKEVYVMNGVSSIENFSKGLAIVKSNGDVLGLDVDKFEGSVQYRHGKDYKTCGIIPAGDSYALCVQNFKETNSVLYIEQDKTSDGIDQAIADILDEPAAKTVSIYGKYIFISPNAGELRYISSIRGYDYDPETLRYVNERIKAAVKDAGIDQKTYTVKNTLQ